MLIRSKVMGPSMYSSAVYMCTPKASHLEHHGIAAEGKRTQPYVMFFA